MNILVTQSGFSFSKSNRKELLCLLRDAGHSLYFLDQSVKDQYKDEFGDVLIPIRKQTSRNNKNPIKELQFIYALCNAFRMNRIDCILVYGIKIIPSMLFAAKLAGIKRRVCVINGAGNLFVDGGIKVKLLRIIAFPMLKLAFSLSDVVFVQNGDDYKMLVECRLLSQKKAKRVNGSGVNLDNYQFAALSPDTHFLLITRITRQKGIREYVDAACKVKQVHPSACFHLVGPRDDLDKSVDWEHFNEAVKCGTIIYHGSAKDVKPYILDSRVFVFPSYYREGVPRAVLEAMSMGRPIITTSAPGCRETVEEGRNGFLVKPRDADDLAEKMCWMINNPEALDEMGRNSRKLAEERFDIHKVNQIIAADLLEGN